jgi:hypothetical protein
MKHKFYDGKYTVEYFEDGRLNALRYGEVWRDLAGDGLVLAMLQDYDDLKTKYDDLVELLDGRDKQEGY